jgi:hypothetical protein
MSGTAGRASKREIRRAFGDEAVALIGEHEDAIKAHTEQFRLMRVEQTRTTTELFNLRLKLANEMLPRTLTLRQRLRWLLTGK